MDSIRRSHVHINGNGGSYRHEHANSAYTFRNPNTHPFRNPDSHGDAYCDCYPGTADAHAHPDARAAHGNAHPRERTVPGG